MSGLYPQTRLPVAAGARFERRGPRYISSEADRAREDPRSECAKTVIRGVKDGDLGALIDVDFAARWVHGDAPGRIFIERLDEIAGGIVDLGSVRENELVT